MDFAVVQFLGSNEVAVVPCSWLYEDRCFWPPKSIESKVLPCIEKKIPPSETWDLYRITTLGVFGTYNDAQRKLLISEEKSDHDTTDPDDVDKEKPCKKRRRYSSFSSTSEEDIQEDTPLPITESNRYLKENVRPVIETLNTQRQTVSSLNVSTDIPSNSSLLAMGNITNSSDDKTEGYLKAILKSVRLIRARMEVLEGNVDILLKNQTSVRTFCAGNRVDAPKDVIKLLPLTSMDDMQLVENKLSDQIIANQMICFLQRVGGDSFDQSIKLMLKKMITDELAMSFSYLGQRSKLSFKSLNICKLIVDAVRTNSAHSGVTDVEVDKSIGNWLRHAKSRIDQRKSNRL